MSDKAKNARIEAIFLEALEKVSPLERRNYLDVACGDDAELRGKVEALLRSHADAGSFLESPPTGVLLPATVNESLHSAGLIPPDLTEPTLLDGFSLDFLTPSAKSRLLGTLGPYEITAVIGHGGMGIVLKGYDSRLHRTVAIKVLSPALASNTLARKRFLREAQAAAAVSHDHVVAIHAVDEVNGLPYLVMEYVEGQSLQQRLDASGPMQPQEILRIGRQIASGLAAAHEQGLIHRDIKPANILLENGVERVKITDFGLARAVDDISVTRTGEVAGTPQYMSPEQAGAERVDHRSDLFSLGCVLYAMCTGRPPFRADSTIAVLRRVCEDKPRPIAELNPEIPESLGQIITQLLAKSPDDRFQSAADVSDVLASLLAHLQQPSVIAAPKIRPRYRQATAERLEVRRRHWAAAAAGILLLFGGLGLTEATGVTAVVPTVIRVVTGEGTLVIAVDDPTVSVRIDGEELVVTGAGLKEIRLTPGQYRVDARKDGRTIRSHLVRVDRGGKTVVDVSLESERPPVASAKLRQELELVVRAGRRGLTEAEKTALKQQEHALFGLLEEPMFKGMVGILAGLPRASHEHLLREGYLKWAYASLDEDRRAAFEEVVQTMFEKGKELGFHAFEPAGTARDILQKSDVGFAVVKVPGSQRQVVSFFVYPHDVPLPIATPIVFSEPRDKPDAGDMGELHFEQLRPLRDKPNSPLPQVEQQQNEWVQLFNGRDLSGWTTHPDQPGNWHVQDGILIGSSGLSYLYTERNDFENFHLRVEAKVNDGGNAGVGFRCGFGPEFDPKLLLEDASSRGETPRHLWLPLGYEAEINSSDPGQQLTRTGGLWCLDSAPLVQPFRKTLVPPDTWFTLEVVTEGRRIVIKVNGHTTIDFTAPNNSHRAGRFALQVLNKASIVQFRKIELARGSSTPREISRETRVFHGHLFNIHAVVFSPDGRRALSASNDKTVRLWDIGTGRELQQFVGHTAPVVCVAFSPDGRYAVSGSQDSTVRLWDIASGHEVRRFEGHSGQVYGIAFSPDGERIASSSADWEQQADRTIRLWDVETGTEIRRFVGHVEAVMSIAFSPDGTRLLSGSDDRTVRLWDVATGAEVRRFPHASRVYSVAFSPDGRRFVSGTGGLHIDQGMVNDPVNSAVHLWDLESEQKIRKFVGHTGGVRSVAFSHDGRYVVSASGGEHFESGRFVETHDNTVRLWDVSTGTERCRFTHLRTVLSVSMSPNGSEILSAGVGNSFYLWTVPSDLIPDTASPTERADRVQRRTSTGSTWSFTDVSELNMITRDGVEVEEKAWRITADKPRTVQLFEVENPKAENSTLVYCAKLKTENLEGKAYLEMWVRAPGKGEFFSKDLIHSVTGSTDWASYETPFFLKQGEHVDLVKLNLAIQGTGTVWIKEIELLKSPLYDGNANDR